MILSSIGIIASKAAAAGGYDADAQAFFTAADPTGTILTTTMKDAVNTMVLSLKSNSLWSKFVALYPMVGGTADTHKFNLKNPLNTDAAYRLGFDGSWSHSGLGAITNGSNTLANTYLNQNNSALPQNSTSIWWYSRNIPTIAGCLFSVLDSYNGIKFELRSPSGGGAYQCLNSYEQPENDGSALKIGLIGFSRISGTEYKRYGQGTVQNTFSRTSNPGIPYPIYMGCKRYSPNVSTSPFSNSEYTNSSCSFAGIGVGFDAAEAAALNTIVNTYQIALSRSVL